MGRKAAIKVSVNLKWKMAAKAGEKRRAVTMRKKHKTRGVAKNGDTKI